MKSNLLRFYIRKCQPCINPLFTLYDNEILNYAPCVSSYIPLMTYNLGNNTPILRANILKQNVICELCTLSVTFVSISFHFLRNNSFSLTLNLLTVKILKSNRYTRSLSPDDFLSKPVFMFTQCNRIIVLQTLVDKNVIFI